MNDRRTAARFRQRLASLVTSDINRVADVIVSVGKKQFSKEEAVSWLLNSEDGQSLMENIRKKEPPMSRNEELQALVKRQGVTSICKVILEDDQYAKAVSEAEFTSMMIECGK